MLSLCITVTKTGTCQTELKSISLDKGEWKKKKKTKNTIRQQWIEFIHVTE